MAWPGTPTSAPVTQWPGTPVEPESGSQWPGTRLGGPVEAPASVAPPQSFDPFGISQGPGPRPDLGEAPAQAPATAQGLERFQDPAITGRTLEQGELTQGREYQPGPIDRVAPYINQPVKQIGTGLVEAGAATTLRGIGVLQSLAADRDPGMVSAIDAIQKGAGIDEAVAAAPTAAPTTPVSATSAYQLGDTISKAVGSDQPDPVLHPVATDIFRGLGSVAGSIISTPLTLGTGPILSGMGEAAQNAVQAKATPEQQQRAGLLGTAAGATDFADLLLVMGGSPGKALSLIKRIGLRVLYGAMIEGGQEAVQQTIQNAIQQGVYDPTKPLFADVPYNFFIGAVVGGAVKGLSPGDPRPASQIGAEAATTAQSYATLTGEALPRAVDEMAAATPLMASAPAEPGKATVVNAGFDSPVRESLSQESVFFSQLRRVAEAKIPESASGSQIMATLRNASGVRQEEIDATGVEAYLASQPGRVSKADLIAYLEDRAIEVKEEIKGRDMGPQPGIAPAQYASYVTPGERGAYRELLLTLPARKGSRIDEDIMGRQIVEPGPNDYRGSHWDEPNVVAHVRFTQRTDRANRPTLHIEEIQSDWGQAGRKLGYDDPKLTADWDAKMAKLTREEGDLRARYMRENAAQGAAQRAGDEVRTQLARERANSFSVSLTENLTAQADLGVRPVSAGAVPDMPFKTSWPELALKRMIRWAADNGYQQISWNSGDLAAKYAAGDVTDPKTVAGLREFYDRILPSIAKRLGKRFGAQVGQTTVDIGVTPFGVAPHTYVDPVTGTPSFREGARKVTNPAYTTERRVWTLEIPVSAATQIQSGLPLFQMGRPTGGGDNITAKMDSNVSPEFKKGITKLLSAVNEFAKKFNMAQKILVMVHNGPIPGEKNARGVASKLVNGNYIIRINATKFSGNVADAYATLMHEFGHVVMWEHFSKLTGAEKLAIEEAHMDFLRSNPSNTTVGHFLNQRMAASRVWMEYNEGPIDTLMTQLTPTRAEYHLSFREWFADQVAKWATTDQEAVGIVDRAMQGIGKALRLFYEFVGQKLGIDARPTLVMQNWLSSFLTGAPPITQHVYAQQHMQSMAHNQVYMAPGVPATPQTASTQPPRAAAGQVFGGATPPGIQQAAAHADRINWFYAYFATLHQMVDANPFFGPLLRYAQKVQLMHIDEAKIQDAAGRILKDWRRLGTQAENLSNFIDQLNNQVYVSVADKKRGVSRHPTSQEFAALVQSTGLDANGRGVFVKIKDFFDKFLVLMAENAIADARRMITDPVKLGDRVTEIRAHIQTLSARPYFPMMRFGKHFVTVRDTAGKVIFFRTYERKGLQSAEKIQMKAAEALRRNYADVKTGVLPDETDHFLGLPTLLLQSMKQRMTLTPAQLDALEQLQFEMSPSLSFRHRFQHRDYTPGYSSDFMRSFASYAFFGAKYYGRTKWAWQLRDEINEAGKVGGNKAGKIRNYMSDHLEKTILDARGDYGLLKGMIFHWQLGYVPAAATQNLAQTPMITFPHLATHFGDARAIRAMGNAMRQFSNFYKKGTVAQSSVFRMKALDYGIKTGRVSETQAAELAGLSHSQNLGYGMGTNEVQRGLIWVKEKSAWMFEMAEQANRRTAFAATLELAMENPNAKYVKEAITRKSEEYAQLIGPKYGFSPTEAAAIVTAVHTVEQTQFVYARYNRPRLFRGKISGSVLVFQMYTQHIVMLMLNGNKGFIWRYLLLAMLVGGMGGIPGFEELKQIVEAALKHAGYNASLDLMLRRWFKDQLGFESSVPPDLVLHGLARRGFGIPAMMDLAGSFATGVPGRGLDMIHSRSLPWPVLDRSKAITTGHILPVDLGKILYPNDVNKAIAEQTQRASGAGFSVGFNIYKAIFDNKYAASDPKRYERAVPRMLGGIAKGFRMFEEERDRGTGGKLASPTIVNYDTRDTEHMMEIIAQAMGYNTLRTQLKWDAIIAQNEHSAYIEGKRKSLYAQMTEAVLGKDSREIDKVTAAIEKFNTELSPVDRGLSITRDSLTQSVHGRLRDKYMKEADVPVQRGRVPISQEILSLFPETAVEIRQR